MSGTISSGEKKGILNMTSIFFAQSLKNHSTLLFRILLVDVLLQHLCRVSLFENIFSNSDEITKEV